MTSCDSNRSGLGDGNALSLLPWLVALAAAAISPAHADLSSLAAQKAEQAHGEMWRRFVDEHGIVIDYTDLEGNYPRSTPEECREGKPNALAWWTATENGGMFNGTYMDAAVLRWKRSGTDADAEKARRLAKGLMLLASVSEVPGFIARNVATDGRTPYPMGSNDQTAPWLYGMWRYLDSGLASEEEKAAMVAKVESVADALAASGWRMPCDTGAPSPYRGTFAGDGWEFAPRLLFLMKWLHLLTGKEVWAERYRTALHEQGQVSGMTRLEICKRGMLFEHERRHSWTCASGVIGLRGLWELEDDPELKAAYAAGLKAGAELALTSLSLHEEFDPVAQQPFHADWRTLNEWWKPQASEQEAVDVALVQNKELGKRSPRRYREFAFVREPAYAAWLVTLCPDTDFVRQHRAEIEKVIAHYDYSQLYYSQFFPVEAAWHRLQEGE